MRGYEVAHYEETVASFMNSSKIKIIEKNLAVVSCIVALCVANFKTMERAIQIQPLEHLPENKVMSISIKIQKKALNRNGLSIFQRSNMNKKLTMRMENDSGGKSTSLLKRISLETRGMKR